MTLKDDNFPASAAFDLIASSLSSPDSKAAAMKSGGKAIFAFTLTNPSTKASASWYIDLKTTGEVGKGVAPDGQKPDVVLSFNEEDFGKLIEGKVQAQRLFMGGKMKVKGDIMKATKAEVVLKNARASLPKAKL